MTNDTSFVQADPELVHWPFVICHCSLASQDRHERKGIHAGPGQPNRPVQVRAGRSSCGPYFANDLRARELLSFLCGKSGKMANQRVQPESVVDNDRVAGVVEV